MERHYKTLDTQIQTDDAHRRMTFTISTGAVDRDGDTLDPKGWVLDAYRRNPTVLFGHDYHSLPVAKTIDIQATDRALIATAEFPPKGVYPFADQVYDMLKHGFLNATSVGFQALEHEPATDRKSGFNFRKQELLEYSIVPIPSNPEALISQRAVNHTQVAGWTKQLGTWFTKHQPIAQQAILDYAAKTKKTLTQTPEAYAAFEKDYLVETEEGDKSLSEERLEKLLALHGIKEPESADHTQAAAMRRVHGAAMDAYAHAHYADRIMQMMRTTGEDMKQITGGHKMQLEDAHGAVQRARDHAMAAADHCMAMGKAMGIKMAPPVTKPLPTPNDGETEQEFVSRCAGNDTMNHDYPDNAQRVAVCYSQWRRHHREADPITKQPDEALFLELVDPSPSILEFDDKDLSEALGAAVAQMAAREAKQAINKALGRLD